MTFRDKNKNTRMCKEVGASKNTSHQQVLQAAAMEERLADAVPTQERLWPATMLSDMEYLWSMLTRRQNQPKSNHTQEAEMLTFSTYRVLIDV